MNPTVSLLGIALWALVPGFIAKSKGRSFLVFYSLSFVLTPLLTTIITLCLGKAEEIVPQGIEGGVTAKESGQLVFDNQRPDSDDYGISILNPICINNLQGETEYLQLLRTPTGESFTWKGPTPSRVDCNGVKDVGIDKYELLLNGETYKSIFFVPYTKRSTFPPSGLVLIGGSSVEEIKEFEALKNKTPDRSDDPALKVKNDVVMDVGSSTKMNETELQEDSTEKKNQQWKASENLETVADGAKTIRPIEQALFCRECGRKLAFDAMFCPECGTKVIRVSADKTKDEPEKILPALTKESILDPAPADETQPTRGFDYLYKSLSPTLRRAFILAEDGDWERADSYFEKVLDEEPENAYAYVGKLLVRERAHSIDQLSTYSDLSNDKLFQRAMGFANDDLKQALQELSSAIKQQ